MGRKVWNPWVMLLFLKTLIKFKYFIQQINAYDKVFGNSNFLYVLIYYITGFETFVSLQFSVLRVKTGNLLFWLFVSAEESGSYTIGPDVLPASLADELRELVRHRINRYLPVWIQPAQIEYAISSNIGIPNSDLPTLWHSLMIL